jgi:hypothetical protein
MHLTHVDQIGSFVRVPGSDDMYDIRDPEACARFRDALKRLVARGLAEHDQGVLYRLTSSGWDVAHSLGAADARTDETIRRQTMTLYMKERDRIEPEGPRAFDAKVRELHGKGLPSGATALTALTKCASDFIGALARARTPA